MLRFYPFYLVFLSTFQLFRQTKNNYQTLIYQISPKEYIQLEKGAILHEKHLHTLVDSTYKNTVFTKLGYFIKKFPSQQVVLTEQKHSLNLGITTVVAINKIMKYSENISKRK